MELAFPPFSPFLSVPSNVSFAYKASLISVFIFFARQISIFFFGSANQHIYADNLVNFDDAMLDYCCF